LDIGFVVDQLSTAVVNNYIYNYKKREIDGKAVGCYEINYDLFQ